LAQSHKAPFDLWLSQSIGVRNKGGLCPLNCCHLKVPIQVFQSLNHLQLRVHYPSPPPAKRW
jgi:hypothetical protein